MSLNAFIVLLLATFHLEAIIGSPRLPYGQCPLCRKEKSSHIQCDLLILRPRLKSHLETLQPLRSHCTTLEDSFHGPLG